MLPTKTVNTTRFLARHPSIDPEVHYALCNIPYLKESGVALIAVPFTNLSVASSFLDGFDRDIGFKDYLHDPDVIDDPEELVKFAGQLCYLSFGPKRSWNKDAKKYLDNIKASGHGSVLEHANFSFLFWGIDRSVTHELVRHRAGFAYCLAGDTLVYSERKYRGNRAGSRKRRIRDIFEMTKTSHGRSRLKLITLRCYDGKGLFTTTKIKAVMQSGIKDLFRVTLSNGKSIRCSKDHRFLTRSGWVRVEDLCLGDELATNGQPAYKSKEWMELKYHGENLSQEEIAAICGVSSHCIRAWVRKHGLTKPIGSWTRGVTPWNKGKSYSNGNSLSAEQRAAISKRMKGEGNHRWKGDAASDQAGRLRANKLYTDLTACEKCGSDGRLHRHHKDRNSPDNIQILCDPCHKATHLAEHGPNNLLAIRWSKIISIEPDGREMTYDIEVEHPEHNFVANGFVTHNSQCSQRYVDGSRLRFVERPEFQPERLPSDASDGLKAAVGVLHAKFVDGIEAAVWAYESRAESLELARSVDHPALQGGSATELRKHLNQVARECLPNCTEAPIVVTANARAWRHFVEMRASRHADVQIRELAIKALRCLQVSAPLLFDDYSIVTLPDGTEEATTPYRKV